MVRSISNASKMEIDYHSHCNAPFCGYQNHSKWSCLKKSNIFLAVYGIIIFQGTFPDILTTQNQFSNIIQNFSIKEKKKRKNIRIRHLSRIFFNIFRYSVYDVSELLFN